MAAVIVCDKCGMTHTNESKFMHIRAHKLASATTYKNETEKYMDICLDCYKKVFSKEDNNNGN